MNDYTPTTGEVGIVYTGHETPVASEAEFDRWLAAHDAEVAAAALEELADSEELPWMDGVAGAEVLTTALRARAAAIRSATSGGESP